MSGLAERVLAAFEGNLIKDRWQSLIELYRADRELFYLLACGELAEDAPQELRDLAVLAGRVRKAVRESYQIEPTDEGIALISYSGGRTPIPTDLAGAVREFLREVDGKTTSDRPGKDYEGTEISEAEMRFKLGDPGTWERERAQRELLLDAKPFVLRVDPEDLTHLSTQPPYVTYELLHCVRRTVLASTCAFRGLKRGGDAPPKVNRGWAFFGKPRTAYRNNGTAVPASAAQALISPNSPTDHGWRTRQCRSGNRQAASIRLRATGQAGYAR